MAFPFGYLFWQYGLEAAMLSHFSLDILTHVIVPLLASSQDVVQQGSSENPVSSI